MQLCKQYENPYKPTVIKPNISELYQLLNQPLDESLESLKQAVSQPLFEGIEWIIVSLGAQGAFAKHNNTFYRVNIPKISVLNPVGSGDSTVAGITSAIINHENDHDLLKSQYFRHAECARSTNRLCQFK